jgi:hypothetical protein
LAWRTPGLRDWAAAVDALYEPGEQAVAITPALPGQGGAWVLATGFTLAVQMPDIALLSQKTGGEVQYFASHRVSETHIWARASAGGSSAGLGGAGRAAKSCTGPGGRTRLSSILACLTSIAQPMQPSMLCSSQVLAKTA